MEYLLFPKKTYYLTQGFGLNSYSHQYRPALDVSAANGGTYDIYAPFSGYVAKKYVDSRFAYSIWLVSSSKVICADGIARYAVAMFTHPKEIASLKVNQTFKQGDLLMKDGDTGHATGLHLDMEVAVYDKKEDIVADWHEVKGRSGYYKLCNSINPCDVMVLKEDGIIKNEYYLNKQYHFKKISEVPLTSKYEIGLYKTLAVVRVRKGPGINFEQKRVKELSKNGQENATSSNMNGYACYKKDTYFDALEIIKNSDSEYWAKGYSGYINIEKDGVIACSKV